MGGVPCTDTSVADLTGGSTSNHRLERAVRGGGAPRARFAMLRSCRAGSVGRRPLNLIVRVRNEIRLCGESDKC